MKKTKIVATLGPASSDVKILKEMICSGVDVCRLNFSHGSHDDHAAIMTKIHSINKELKTHIAILADLQGPKIRLGELGDGIAIEPGMEVTFTTDKTKKGIWISYAHFARDVKAGEQVLVDDGKILLKVLSSDQKSQVKLKVIQGELLKSKKGVNLPNTEISQPSLTEKDLKDIEFILTKKVQWIALSFVRSASDIIELRHILAKNPSAKKPSIIAKIEKPEALEDIDNIIREADGIMVARGDLGVEIPLEEVPLIQKQLVQKCLKASKPIIIATQMMEGMIDNISPTRAEVTDVANAVLDGADALMLSGETSVGKHPIDVIKTMSRIISRVENNGNIYYKHFLPDKGDNGRYISNSILYSACEIAQQTDARAIISMTHSGFSANKIASQRPKAEIFIFTNNHFLLSKLNLMWGVRGFYYDKFISTDHTIQDIKYLLRKWGYVEEGDLVVNIASMPIEEHGKTNMLKLSSV